MDADELLWQQRAACTVDPELWTSQRTAGKALHQCLRHCPVLEQCRTWAAGKPWSNVVVAGVRWAAVSTREDVAHPARRQTEEVCDGCAGKGGCTECGSPIQGRAAHAKTCSRRCGKSRQSRRRQAEVPEPVVGGRKEGPWPTRQV